MTKLITDPSKVKEIILKSGIEIKEGVAYNVYECKHVIPVEDDPQIKEWITKTKSSLRVCPNCKKKVLLAKYKMCFCKEEQISFNLNNADFCQFCYKQRYSDGTINEKGEKRKKAKSKFRNSNKYDPSKWNCMFRNECREEWKDYDVIPCKDCEKYIGGRLQSNRLK